MNKIVYNTTNFNFRFMQQNYFFSTKLKAISVLVFSLFFISFSWATSNLSPQDIVILQVNTDGGHDELALLVLEDIPPNEVFFISDISWDGGFAIYSSASEEAVKMTVNGTGLSAGTIIRIDNPSGSLYTLQDPTQGTLSFIEVDNSPASANELTLSTSGDQVIIFKHQIM